MEIRDEMRHMLARVGWKPDFIEKSVPVLPISGWMGDNLIKQSTNMAWWKGQEVVSADNRKVQVNCLLDVSTALGSGRWGGVPDWGGAAGQEHAAAYRCLRILTALTCDNCNQLWPCKWQ